MAFDILLFDLDNTLLDFDANEEVSLNDVFLKNGLTLTEKNHKIFSDINLSFWKKYEQGQVTIEEVLIGRFRETLKAIGREDLDPQKIELQYKENLKNGTQMIDGAYEVCKELSKTKKLYIATNGFREIQLSRLNKSGLMEFFECVFDSQSVGAGKPSKEFFEKVSERIPNFQKEKAIMIGDSVSSDISGAIAYGITSCLFLNGRSESEFEDVNCDYKIKKLSELLKIV